MLRYLARGSGGGCHNFFTRASEVPAVGMMIPSSAWSQPPRMAAADSSLTRNRIQKRFKGAFVSRHNISLNVTPQIIMDCCQSHGISRNQLKSTSRHVQIRDCPFCPKPTGGKLSNLYKLYVESSTGAYFCHRCGASGSWYDFKAQLNGGSYSSSSSGSLLQPAVTRFGGGGGGAGAGGGGGGGSSMASGRGYGGEDGDGNVPFSDRGEHHVHSSSSSKEPPLPMPQSRMAALFSSRLLDPQQQDDNDKDDPTNNNNNNSSNAALDYLTTVRGLDRTTLRKYGVGRATYQFAGEKGYERAECVTFPWIMKESDVQVQETLRGADYNYVPTTKPATSSITTTTDKKKAMLDKTQEDTNGSSEKEAKEGSAQMDTSTASDAAAAAATATKRDPFVTRRIKARAVSQKGWQRLDPPGGGWGLFGLHTVPDDATEIVLTEGEYDAMAVSQATGRPAVSLPNGCRSLPVPVLPLLERYSKIYLWMDNDVPGQEGAEKFAKKLGLNRCHIVTCRDAKDANDALLQGLDLEQYIRQASVVPHDRLLTFQDLRAEVLHELLEPDLYKGSPIPSLPGFTNLIKGFRRGELTVLTGATGSGKTTFLGQVSLDLAEQGINVLWGSFEIKNTRLLHKLLKQYSRDALPHCKDPQAMENLNALADRFENLPMHFLRFHGGSDIDEVLDAMEYAVYVYDTEHIILDNMQFMLTRSANAKGGSWEKFDVQDIAIEKFRKFATQHNVHLTLVVHPRKEDEAMPLNISSFYGSAKATQEADTVLILQTSQDRCKKIEVKKNRFDGTLGSSNLFFESKSGRYVETEGGRGGAPMADGSHPYSIVAQSPRKGWKQPMERRKPDPEPENLANHWDDMLTPKGDGASSRRA